MPTNSCTNTVTNGCTARVLNCAMNSTKNSGRMPAAPIIIARPRKPDRPRCVPSGRTKCSFTPRQTRNTAAKVIAAVQ